MAGEDQLRRWQQQDAAHFLHPFTDSRLLGERGTRVITHAEGVYLHEADGNRLLDGMAWLWCVAVGYCRQELVDGVDAGHATPQVRSSMAAAKVARVRSGAKSANRRRPAATNPSRTPTSDTTRHTAAATTPGDYAGRVNLLGDALLTHHDPRKRRH